MGELRININLDNDAFQDDPDGEVMRILSRVIDGLRENTPLIGGDLGKANTLFDSNGNRVGQIKVHESDDQQG